MVIDTEGMLAVSDNENERKRLLLKVPWATSAWGLKLPVYAALIRSVSQRERAQALAA